MELDITKRYHVEGFPGTEFYTLGWCMVWIPDDEHKKEGSWVSNPSSGQAIMIPVGEETEYYIDAHLISEVGKNPPELLFSD